LVFGTLHTNSAPQTINRIIDVFSGDEQPQVRAQLSTSLISVISQALLPKIGGGRIAAQEIFNTNPAIANLIREDKVHQLYSQMQLNQSGTGMITQTQELEEYLRKKIITKESALQYANRPDELIRQIQDLM
jgi:twitching motility protein PilT